MIETFTKVNNCDTNSNKQGKPWISGSLIKSIKTRGNLKKLSFADENICNYSPHKYKYIYIYRSCNQTDYYDEMFNNYKYAPRKMRLEKCSTNESKVIDGNF